MVTTYNNRHAFLSEADSTHTINLILNLIYKEILKKTDILLILHGSVLSNKSIEDTCKNHDICVLRWEDIRWLKLSFLTLNPLSLLTSNSEIITYCINNKFVEPSSINILMQDDELDRWNKLYNKNGSLQVNDQALIDENVLKILQIVDNYVIPYNFLGKKLEGILGRKLNIIDAVLPFNVLDYHSQNVLEEFIDARKQSKNKNYYSILLYTKPGNMKNNFYTIALFLMKNKNITFNKKIIIGIWFGHGIKGAFFRKALSLLVKANNNSITIENHESLTHGQYFLMLHQYDCLILQSRGGFSTAKYFAEKVGKVITLTDSPNDLCFRQNYGINTFCCKTLMTALEYAIESSQVDETEKINNYISAINKRHDSSFKLLQNFWQRL